MKSSIVSNQIDAITAKDSEDPHYPETVSVIKEARSKACGSEELVKYSTVMSLFGFSFQAHTNRDWYCHALV